MVRLAVRLDDHLLRLDFDGGSYGVDLTRGNALIYPLEERITTKRYRAPFDQMLAKRLTKARILNVSCDPHDRILRVTVESQQGYKAHTTTLQLELTGRHTNAILLDESNRVLEAWRHISADVSSRPVRIGMVLQPLTPRLLHESPPTDERSIDEILRDEQRRRDALLLERLKASHCAQLTKRLETIEREYQALPQSDALFAQADKLSTIGQLLLANLHLLKPYQRRVELEDFDGKRVTIDLPELPSITQLPEWFFHRARKLRQKAKGVHLEEANLKGLADFTRRLLAATRNASSPGELALLFPARETTPKELQPHVGEVAHFLIEGERVLIGRNERGNAYLLKTARAGDLWMHLKDRPSAHLIIPTNKKSLPKSLLYEAAKLLVSLSVDQAGSYLVDYTHRRYVRPQEGAQVLYTHHKTLKITKGR